jgi:hypothetical protein
MSDAVPGIRPGLGQAPARLRSPQPSLRSVADSPPQQCRGTSSLIASGTLLHKKKRWRRRRMGSDSLQGVAKPQSKRRQILSWKHGRSRRVIPLLANGIGALPGSRGQRDANQTKHDSGDQHRRSALNAPQKRQDQPHQQGSPAAARVSCSGYPATTPHRQEEPTPCSQRDRGKHRAPYRPVGPGYSRCHCKRRESADEKYHSQEYACPASGQIRSCRLRVERPSRHTVPKGRQADCPRSSSPPPTCGRLEMRQRFQALLTSRGSHGLSRGAATASCP